MVNVCYIGILALKKGKTEIFNKIKKEVA